MNGWGISVILKYIERSGPFIEQRLTVIESNWYNLLRHPPGQKSWQDLKLHFTVTNHSKTTTTKGGQWSNINNAKFEVPSMIDNL